MICLNRRRYAVCRRGDQIIIMAYCKMTPEEAAKHSPKVVFVDDENRISCITNYEKHGLLKICKSRICIRKFGIVLPDFRA